VAVTSERESVSMAMGLVPHCCEEYGVHMYCHVGRLQFGDLTQTMTIAYPGF
jgi:hypothetical protein